MNSNPQLPVQQQPGVPMAPPPPPPPPAQPQQPQQPQVIYVQQAAPAPTNLNHTVTQVNTTKVRGRLSLTRIIIAFCTVGLSLPFLGIHKGAAYNIKQR